MTIERLSVDAIQRVSGPSWEPLREPFLQISEILLSASPEAIGVLTTIYVKYQLTDSPSSGVFAVAWLKNSKHVVVGLALPEDHDSPLLGPAPQGMKYKGINRYFTVKPGDTVPNELHQWAIDAYQYARAGIT